MALTARQRNALPPSAFVIKPNRNRSSWAYPLPTAAMARRAGISEAQRQRMLRAAVSFAARRGTRGSYARIARLARQRAGAASLKSGTPWRSKPRRTSTRRTRRGRRRRR
jgi:hypothetical protein